MDRKLTRERELRRQCLFGEEKIMEDVREKRSLLGTREDGRTVEDDVNGITEDLLYT